MTTDLDDDPRWRRLHDNTWVCPCCGESHGGLFDIGLERPAACASDQPRQPNSELDDSDNILTDDFCVVDGEHFFVRCVMLLPIVGASGFEFGWGVWSSLSQANFDLHVGSFNNNKRDDIGPWFGWFSNHLHGYPDTFGLECEVHPQNDGQRPLIEPEPTDHPLSLQQRNGITLDRILDIYAEYGHDMRDALSA